MNKSIIHELYYKVFRSGDRLVLFIGINTLVFLLINLINIVEFVFTQERIISSWLKWQMGLPAYLPELGSHFWSVVTHLFGSRGLFDLFFDMFWLYWIGQIFLNFLNPRQFTFVYLAGGIVGALFFVFGFNLFPPADGSLHYVRLFSSSGCVMAVFIATATLVPDYSIHLMFLGRVKLKYLIFAYFLLKIMGIAGTGIHFSDNITQIGGAMLGFLYIKRLQNGSDWSKILNMYSEWGLVNKQSSATLENTVIDQAVIDAILDKISKSGYDSLTSLEKKQLFKASGKE